jgi:hypothetical protein
MPRLPNSERAILDIRKLEDYCLNPQHPRGRHKARVFREALGVTQSDSSWLRSSLLAALPNAEALELASDGFGRRWRIDVLVARQGKSVMVRMAWIVPTGETAPRFVTCWVLR